MNKGQSRNSGKPTRTQTQTQAETTRTQRQTQSTNPRTNEPRRQTQATKSTNSGDEPMNLGGETHEPKLGLNSRTCMIPSGEGRFEFSLHSLFYISAE